MLHNKANTVVIPFPIFKSTDKEKCDMHSVTREPTEHAVQSGSYQLLGCYRGLGLEKSLRTFPPRLALHVWGRHSESGRGDDDKGELLQRKKKPP